MIGELHFFPLPFTLTHFIHTVVSFIFNMTQNRWLLISNLRNETLNYDCFFLELIRVTIYTLWYPQQSSLTPHFKLNWFGPTVIFNDLFFEGLWRQMQQIKQQWACISSTAHFLNVRASISDRRCMTTYYIFLQRGSDSLR